MALKGLYIEDDQSNLIVNSKLFRQEGFEMTNLPELPSDINELYPMVMEHRPDFLLIDHELNKLTGYSGFEALTEIRKHDRSIYAILLTNYKMEDYKDEFGAYDLQVHKSELANDEKLAEISSKICRACERTADLSVLAQLDEVRKLEEEKLSILRQIHKSVQNKD